MHKMTCMGVERLCRDSSSQFDERSYTHHNFVEIFNKQGAAMATVNFSVPEDIKNAFNTVFEGQNKSAVIADLMRGRSGARAAP